MRSLPTQKLLVRAVVLFAFTAFLVGGFLASYNSVHARQDTWCYVSIDVEQRDVQRCFDTQAACQAALSGDRTASSRAGQCAGGAILDSTQQVQIPTTQQTDSNIDITKLLGEDQLPKCWLGVTEGISFAGCGAQFFFYILLVPAGWILGIVAEIFDIAIAFSISNLFLNADFPNDGWGVVRDLTNIAFIFILLYIAVMTILQAGGFKTRELLVNLVIVALLVNFSLFFTKVVIDAGNIVGLIFYEQIAADGRSAAGASASAWDAILPGAQQKNVSGGLLQAFQPQALFGGNLSELETNPSLLIFVFIAGAIIFLATAYALLAMGLIFILRVPILWLLMIAAPAAFLAWILPDTRKYTSQWWSMLLSQSFIVAIALFFLWLIVGASVGLLKIGNIPHGWFDMFVYMFFRSAIVITLILAAVKITRGIAGEGGKIGAATLDRGANWVRTSAGALARRPFAYAGVRARGAAGRAAERAQEAEGRVAATLRSIPGVTQALGVAGRMRDVDVEQAKSQLAGLSNRALKNRAPMITTDAATRAAIVEILAERGDLKPEGDLTAVNVKTYIDTMEKMGRGKGAKDARKISWQYAEGVRDRAAAVPKISPTDIEKVSEQFFNTKPTNTPAMIAMYQNWHGGHIGKLMERTDNADQNFFKGLQARLAAAGMAPTINNVRQLSERPTEMDGFNNRKLASWASSPAGRNILKAYGFK